MFLQAHPVLSFKYVLNHGEILFEIMFCFGDPVDKKSSGIVMKFLIKNWLVYDL